MKQNQNKSGGSVKRALFFTAVGVVCGAGVYHTVRKKRGKPTCLPSVVVENVKYVFPTTEGKSITLQEKELRSIYQMHKIGIRPDKIAVKFNLSKGDILRVINSKVTE